MQKETLVLAGVAVLGLGTASALFASYDWPADRVPSSLPAVVVPATPEATPTPGAVTASAVPVADPASTSAATYEPSGQGPRYGQPAQHGTKVPNPKPQRG